LRSLCVTLNSELIRNNAQTYKDEGGQASIFCSGLGEMDCTHNAVFASPHSLVIALRKNEPISKIPFNLVIIDECHAVNHLNNSTMLMRIIHHYGFMAQSEGHKYRVLGMTGTPYRDKANTIFGEDCFFKEEVCNISASYLIEQGFLVKPAWGNNLTKGFDFSRLKVKSNGKFDEKMLSQAVEDRKLTHDIIDEVVEIANKRNGAFIFASTVRHAKHIKEYMGELPCAIITGETPHSERTEILRKARLSEIKFLISVNALMVGVDVPLFDVCAWLRPTESLILYIQGIGRVLRLHQSKKDAIVLDYAGNLERHGHIDDAIINEALKPKPENEHEYCIPCYECLTDNTIYARRCIGVINKKRCDYYFEFKECPSCNTQNDKVAKYCRSCQHELIDPNAKLKLIEPTYELNVISHEIRIEHDGRGKAMVWFVRYKTSHGVINEHYTLSGQKGRNIFYGQFVRKHVAKSSSYYMGLHSFDVLNKMIKDVKMPRILVVNAEGRIKKKEF
jgi:DNA repair protein RadD